MTAYDIKFRFNAFRRFHNGACTEIAWEEGLNVLPVEDATAVDKFVAEFRRSFSQCWPLDTGRGDVPASEIESLVFFNLPPGKDPAESLLHVLGHMWARMLYLPLVIGYGCSGLRGDDWKVAVVTAAARKGQSILVVDKDNLGKTESILQQIGASYTVPDQEAKPSQ